MQLHMRRPPWLMLLSMPLQALTQSGCVPTCTSGNACVCGSSRRRTESQTMVENRATEQKPLSKFVLRKAYRHHAFTSDKSTGGRRLFGAVPNACSCVAMPSPSPPSPPAPPSPPPSPRPPPVCMQYDAVAAMCAANATGQSSLVARLFGKNTLNYETQLAGACATNGNGDQGFYVTYVKPGGYSSNTLMNRIPIHFHPDDVAPTTSSVTMSWVLQGGDDGTRCTTTTWVPLNGPGYYGGNEQWIAACPGGFTCLQGSSTPSRDGPISASYTSATYNGVTQLLTWSGSDPWWSNTCGTCTCSAAIPTSTPALWFTQLSYQRCVPS